MTKKSVFSVLAVSLAFCLCPFFLFAGEEKPYVLPDDLGTWAKKGLEGVYAIRLGEAKKYFEKAVEKYPKHPLGHFGLAMLKWARLEYKDERSNPELDREYTAQTDKVAEIGEAWVKEHPSDAYAYLCLGGIYGLRARLAVTQHRWLKAYLDGRKAVKNMKKAVKINPGLYDAYLGLGMYEYYAGTLPGVVGLLSKLLFISGDAEKGIEYLKLCKDKGYYNATAAKLLLIEIFTERADNEFYDPETAVKWSAELRKKYPVHPMMHFVEIVSLYEAGMYEKVREEGFKYLRNIKEGVELYDEKYVPRALVAIATAYMVQGKYGESMSYFSEAAAALDASDVPGRWAVWALVRIGNLHDLKGNRKKALEYYGKAMAYEDQWGFREDVKEYVKTPFSRENIPCQLPPP